MHKIYFCLSIFYTLQDSAGCYSIQILTIGDFNSLGFFGTPCSDFTDVSQFNATMEEMVKTMTHLSQSVDQLQRPIHQPMDESLLHEDPADGGQQRKRSVWKLRLLSCSRLRAPAMVAKAIKAPHRVTHHQVLFLKTSRKSFKWKHLAHLQFRINSRQLPIIWLAKNYQMKL